MVRVLRFDAVPPAGHRFSVDFRLVVFTALSEEPGASDDERDVTVFGNNTCCDTEIDNYRADY